MGKIFCVEQIMYYFFRILNDNLITTLEPGAFSGLSNLREISLQNNLITYFPALTSLPSLSTLDLSNNQIETLGYETFGGFDDSVLDDM